MRLIYLANPYSHNDKDVMTARYDATMEALAKFTALTEDLCFYSPIISWHEIALRHKLAGDFTYWRKRDFFMIRKAAALWVLPLEGWQESFGVSQEIEFAEDIGRGVMYVLDWTTNLIVTPEKPSHHIPLPIRERA